MQIVTKNHAEPTIDAEALAIHLLHAMSTSAHKLTLEDLATELQVRRADVRSTLSTLHRQGYLDVTKMQLTMAGFAVGRTYNVQPLPSIRRHRASSRRAA